MPWTEQRTFRRKHYLVFQKAIKDALNTLPREDYHGAFLLAQAIADTFSRDSDKFDREKFFEGCGL